MEPARPLDSVQMDKAHDPRNEAAPFPRRALVCVLGTSPQVLTETLYALTKRCEPPWVPTEIHVITTARGAREARAGLLGEGRGRGALRELMDDHLPGVRIAFNGTRQHLHVVQRKGRPLEDIDDPDDSAATGNTILSVVAPLVNDPRCQIHASIAGGRKTMGALLLSAMSLLGRPQDEVSHVLVNSELEGHPHFFYPPSRPRMLHLRDGSTFSTADADLRLARIPILRFAAGMRGKVLEAGHSYEQLVAQAEHDLVPQPVTLSLAACRLQVGAAGVTLEPLEMAWYAYLAERRRQQAAEPGLVAPGMVRVCKDTADNIGLEPAALRRVFSRLPDVQFKPPSARPGEFKLEFASRVSYINRQLREGLGEVTARRLVIVGPGERKRRDGQYGLLHLDPALIHFR